MTYIAFGGTLKNLTQLRQLIQ